MKALVYSLLHTKFHKWKSFAQNSVYFSICFTAKAHHRHIKFFHNAPLCSFLRHVHMVLGISNPCTLSVYSHPLTSRKTGGWCLSLFLLMCLRTFDFSLIGTMIVRCSTLLLTRVSCGSSAPYLVHLNRKKVLDRLVLWELNF